MFNEIKNRDAWSTIRGFVYQVDLTILRWLDLKPNEVLELEKGEDIDIVAKEISKGEISRDLEQIKYREENLSLNQFAVLELLLNFFIHKKNNPSCKLLYRFITNTSYVVERPAIFLDGKSGIETWIELNKDVDLKIDDSRLVKIKKHLTEKILKIISEDTKEKNDWIAFKMHISDKARLLQLIKDFEWSFNNENIDEIAKKVKSLISKNLSTDYNTAELIYSRLFLFVFKLLCNKTLKQLDKSLLIAQIGLPDLDTTDSTILITLNKLLYELDGRISILEKNVSLNTSKLAELIGNPELIANANTIFEYRTKHLSIESPPLIKNGSLRKKKVNEVLSYFKNHSWIGFQGINGTGKTQLASLIIQTYPNYFWLDLRAYNQDIEKTTALLETFLSIISTKNINHFRADWMEDIVNSFHNNTLIVLNDIPKIELGTSFGDLITLFASKIEKSKIKLLTTSNYKVGNEIKSIISNNSFMEIFDFDFSNEEIKEYLINLEANEYVFNSVDLIASFSKRNPRLLSAIIYHLKSINWGENSVDVFDALLKNDFSKNVLNDAQLLVKKFITNEDSKELLYRLSLIYWDFDFKTVKLISNIPAKIPHPYDKMQDLVNLWIQESNDNLFNISPLISKMGENNLSDDIIQNIHLTIANSIIKNEVIDEINASRCITSFLKGKDFNNAGILLINIYNSATTPKQVKHLMSWGYFRFWTDLKIPQQMDIILRSNIRLQQIRLHKIVDKDFSKQRNILEGYLDETGISASEKVLIHLQCLSLVLNDDLSKFWFHSDAILNNISDLDNRYKGVIDIELFSGILWSPIREFKKWSDIEKWLKTITLIEEKFDFDFFENEISQLAISIITSKIIKIENRKEETDRDWQQVISNLDILIDYFTNRNEEVLEAVVLKELISLECQINDDYSKAEIITNEKAEKYTLNDAKYLLYENFGKLQYQNKEISSSNHYLSKAIELDCVSQISFIDTLIYAGTAISELDNSKSVEYFFKALELANLNEDYNELDYVQIQGELAIAYWINNDFENSFKYFELFVNRLFNAKEEYFNEFWIRLFSWSSHALGYISSSVGKEEVPKYVHDGGNYVKPYQGILTFNTKDLTDLYDIKKEPLIIGLMASFADGIDDINKAYTWSLKAFDLARKSGSNDILIMVSTMCSQYSIVNFKVDEALEAYLLFSAINTHIPGSGKEKYDKINDLYIEELVKEKPSENWNIAENLTVTFALIPLFIKLLSTYLGNEIDKTKKTINFIDGIENYINIGSDTNLWTEVLNLTQEILQNSISKRDLIEKANEYGSGDLKNLQIICQLGVIYSTKNKIVEQIINVFPYLIKIYKIHSSIRKNVMLPFVIERSIYAVKNEYVGNKQELFEIIRSIENIDHKDKNSIQMILQIIVNELDISLPIDRKEWVFEYKDIVGIN